MNHDESIPGTEQFGARPASFESPAIDDGQAITTVIENIRAGQFSLDAGQQLSDLVRAVVAQASKGKLTIELEVKKEDGDDWVTMSASCKAAMPKQSWPAIFYPDEAGRLSRNANQQSLGF